MLRWIDTNFFFQWRIFWDWKTYEGTWDWVFVCRIKSITPRKMKVHTITYKISFLLCNFAELCTDDMKNHYVEGISLYKSTDLCFWGNGYVLENDLWYFQICFAIIGTFTVDNIKVEIISLFHRFIFFGAMLPYVYKFPQF